MDRRRVVRLRTKAIDGGRDFRQASGYLVAPGRLLTVAHALLPPREIGGLADTCEVSGWRVRAAIEWRGGERVAFDVDFDLAVVAVPGLGEGLAPVRWGRIEGDADVPWTAIGFPAATRRGERQPDQASGLASPASLETDLRFRLRVDSGDMGSGWGGASGAAVFSDGCLVGIVSERLKTVERSLLAVRAEAVERNPELWEALGRPTFEPVTAEGAVEYQWLQRVEAVTRKLAEQARKLPYSRILTSVDSERRPELTEVYIAQHQVPVERTDEAARRRAKRPGGADDGEPPLPASLPVTVRQTLEQQHASLVIEGDPGAGKSTLLHHLTVTLVDAPTNLGAKEDEKVERVVPLYVAARRIAGGEDPLENRLVHALDVPGLSPKVLTEPRRNVRWLVLVDALDEVIDDKARRDLVDRLRKTARTQPGRFRFVVTSRSLPDLGAFDPASDERPLFVRYRLRPFGLTQRRAFAAAWFRSRPGDPTARADAFNAAIERTTLTDLAGSPLLLTMAAVLFERGGDGALPTNRARIYDEFVGLLWDDESGRGTAEEFERRWRDRLQEPGAVAAEQLFARRHRLLGDVARRYEGGDGGLGLVQLAISSPIVTDALPRNVDVPTVWLREQVELLLRRTGLVTSYVGELAFVHETFREYLAARDVTSTLRIDSEEARRFVEGWSGSQRDVVLFALGIWADKARPEDLTKLLGNIWHPGIPKGRGMQGEWLHRQRQLFAGTAVAEDLPVGSAYRDAIVSALVELAATYGSYAADEPGTVAEEAVRVLARLRRADELEAIATDPRPSWEGSRMEARVEAAALLAQLGRPARSVELLYGFGRRRNARALQALAELDQTQSALDLTRDRIRSGWRFVVEGDEPADYLALLGRLGSPDEAIAAADEVLGELRRVPPATEYRNLRTRRRMNVAAVLSGLGEPDAAAELLVEIACDHRNIGRHRTQAVEHLVAMGRPQELRTVVQRAQGPAPIADAVRVAADPSLGATSLRTRLYTAARWGFLAQLSWSTAAAAADLTAWSARRFDVFDPRPPRWVVVIYGLAWFVAQLVAANDADIVASTKAAVLRLPLRGPFLPWSRLTSWYERLAVWPVGPVLPWAAAQLAATAAGGSSGLATAVFFVVWAVVAAALLYQVFMLVIAVDEPTRLDLHSLPLRDQPDRRS